MARALHKIQTSFGEGDTLTGNELRILLEAPQSQQQQSIVAVRSHNDSRKWIRTILETCGLMASGSVFILAAYWVLSVVLP